MVITPKNNIKMQFCPINKAAEVDPKGAIAFYNRGLL